MPSLPRLNPPIFDRRTLAAGLAVALLTAAPALSAQDPPPLDAVVKKLSRIGSCSSPSFSPDGQRLAFISDLSGSPQVWTVDVDGGWPAPTTALDDQVGAVAWSPTADVLAYSVAPGGGLNQQIFLTSADGTDVRRITDGGRTNNWLAGWTDDGSHVLFSSSRRSPAHLDAYAFQTGSDGLQLLAENPGIGTVQDFDPDGGLAVIYRLESRSDANLFLMDLGAGKETLLTPHEGPAAFVGGTLVGTRVYFGSNLDRDQVAFARATVTDGEAGPVEVLLGREDAGLEGFEIAPAGDSAVLVWNVAGRSELEWVRLDAEGRPSNRVAIDVPSEIASQLTYAPDGRRLAMTLGGSTRPSDIWVLDIGPDGPTGSPRQVTRSPHAGVDLGKLVEPELLTFAAHDGLELSGWLYRPPHVEGKAPFVISFHGGPEGQSRPRFRAVFQALLSRGIGVFDPNVRGSSGFGKRFVNLDNGALRFDGIRDIESTVEALVATGAADPERLGIMGGSYGGYMTMAGLAWYPHLFAAGANLFGVVNFETFFAETEPWMAAISTLEYGDPATQADLLRELSPIHRLDQVEDPTLVLHGANDTNVPVVEAEQVVETLKKRGVPVEYVLFPDEGHGFRKTANRITSDVAITRWFEQHLHVPAPAR
ncbi:MAG: S9 family peptidase [Acidobacteriota bacterium]